MKIKKPCSSNNAIDRKESAQIYSFVRRMSLDCKNVQGSFEPKKYLFVNKTS